MNVEPKSFDYESLNAFLRLAEKQAQIVQRAALIGQNAFDRLEAPVAGLEQRIDQLYAPPQLRLISNAGFDSFKPIGVEAVHLTLTQAVHLQVRPALELVRSDYFQRIAFPLEEFQSYFGAYLQSLPNLAEILGPVLKAQLQFRADFFESVSHSFNPYSGLEEVVRRWTQTLISLRADILGFKFDFQYTKRTYQEHRQVIVDLDERKRYVEVKSTISNKKINFQNIHLTPDEWSVAETLGERYFIYKLSISKENIELFLIQDPVEKYRNKLIKMSPRNGADIVFFEKSGTKEELLIWSK